MVSYTTADLRDEINHYHGGEDSRTAIERHHGRCQNIEGRTLEKDFDSHTPVHGGLDAYVPHPLSSLGVWGGMALAPHLRMVL
jgi:hypothetical protein